MEEEIKILIIEDNPDDAFLVKKMLERSGLQFQSKVVSEKEEFYENLRNEKFNVILSDNSMFDFNARDVLNLLKERNISTPLIIMSGTISDKFADQMIKDGAFAYVSKNDFKSIIETVNRAVR